MKLIIDKVAKSLDLPVTTISRWIRQGRIPIQRKGNNCIFKKSVLEKWAGSHNLTFSMPGSIPDSIIGDVAGKETELQPENLLPVMKRGGVYYNISGDNVETVLSSAVGYMTCLPENKKNRLYEKLIEREKLASTGIGKGVAIPHTRVPLSNTFNNPVISTFFLEKPIGFDAIDNQPVSIIFILLSSSVKNHLHILSRLTFYLRNDEFVNFLKTAPHAEPFFEKIAEIEKQLDEADIC